MKIMGMLLELLVVGVNKEKKKGKKNRAIEREDKFLKELLMTLARIQIEKSMV